MVKSQLMEVRWNNRMKSALSEVCSAEVDQRDIPEAYKSSDCETPFRVDDAWLKMLRQCGL
jgi:hypothetical protein